MPCIKAVCGQKSMIKCVQGKIVAVLCSRLTFYESRESNQSGLEILISLDLIYNLIDPSHQ